MKRIKQMMIMMPAESCTQNTAVIYSTRIVWWIGSRRKMNALVVAFRCCALQILTKRARYNASIRDRWLYLFMLCICSNGACDFDTFGKCQSALRASDFLKAIALWL